MDETSKHKTMEILAGPNGSGKTTLSDLLLKKVGKFRFVNADSIANGLDASSDGAEITAGRVMLKQINESLNEGVSFAFETTLSGRIWLEYIKRAKSLGYQVVIYLVLVKDVDLAVKRVAERVACGGHNVPAETIMRRYRRSKELFDSLYSKVCDKWYIFDNSDGSAEMVAKKENGSMVILNESKYQSLMINN